jgi:hypothetical protein
MSRLRLIIRWACALLVAVTVHVAVLGLGAFGSQHFGADPVSNMDWIIAIATCVAVLGGTVIVPRGQWKTAALAFWMLAGVFYLWLVLRPALSGQFSLAAFQNFGSALTGGFMAYFVTPRWTAQRQSHYDQESVIGTAPRWIKKGWLAFSVLLCCGMVLFVVYQLYSAWRFHTVWVGNRLGDYVSYDVHPIAFLWTVLLNSVVMVMFAACTAGIVWETRLDRSFRRKRETADPLEDAIRQTISER